MRQRDRYRRRRDEGACVRCGGVDDYTQPGDGPGAYCAGCRDEVQVYDDLYDYRRTWRGAQIALKAARARRATRRKVAAG